MSTLQELKKDLRTIKKDWQQLDPSLKYLDMITLIFVTLFGFAFLLVYLGEIPLIVTNIIFMVYPGFISGLTFVYRTQIAEKPETKDQARRDYILTVVIITLFAISSFGYSLLLQ